MLLVICASAFCSVGLVTLALVPQVQAKLDAYFGAVRKSKEELEDLFIMVPRQRLMTLYLVTPVVLTLAAWTLLPNPIVLPVGVVVGFAIPRVFVRLMELKRRMKFQGQLVDALMILSASLKAGMSILQALEVLAEETSPPMADEIGLALKEVKMGLSVDESFSRLKQRMPIDELNLMITTILVARETGGDITGVFNKLIETIRDRQKLKERVKTLTVIPRLQGWIMACIPVVFATFVTGINKAYFGQFFGDPMGQLLAAVAGGLWLLSLVLIMWFSRSPL